MACSEKRMKGGATSRSRVLAVTWWLHYELVVYLASCTNDSQLCFMADAIELICHCGDQISHNIIE